MFYGARALGLNNLLSLSGGGITKIYYSHEQKKIVVDKSWYGYWFLIILHFIPILIVLAFKEWRKYFGKTVN